MKTLTDLDYKKAAEIIGCDIATIKAVALVESNGGGFNKNGTPKILFEGHWFHKLTKGKFTNWINRNISYPKWIRTYYNENQHNRLQKAVLLDRDAALKSASWGKFQIMGFNYDKCGFSNIQDFINAMFKSEGAQLEAFVNFIISRNLDDELRDKNWSRFAYFYNGSGFAKNKYDTKLADAYLKYA
ncbi:N-acetylmuramidase [Polaribacter phage Leef_1]|uniref:N-acetylmuramidase n=1 Tax=Polaribacter phage Leef_1 TaxID=2745684 RepID=A0A8E5EBI3_9CAUD|nr:endolysin [Polaribacter phage Leef_1]QQV91374.1 N-acetylmuramidase [Polaribacter phage Leef_1]